MKRFAGIVGGVALLTSATQTYAQELIVNGSFEQPVVDSPWVQRLPGETFGGWTVYSTGQGIVQVASFGRPSAIDGAQSLELNFFVPCGVQQTVATTPGTDYVLRFLMAGQTDTGPDLKQMRIDWDNDAVATVDWSRSGSGGQWQQHTLVLRATSASTALGFFGLTNVDGGPYLDAVSLVPCLRITENPTDATSCSTGGANFSFAAVGAEPLSYRWQLEVTPDNWVTLGNDPLPLACGGFAYAHPPFASSAFVGVHACPGVHSYRVRGLAFNDCGQQASEPATLSICDWPADINCDGLVNLTDLATLLRSFGVPSGASRAQGDLDGDSDVDLTDLATMLIGFGSSCP